MNPLGNGPFHELIIPVEPCLRRVMGCRLQPVNSGGFQANQESPPDGDRMGSWLHASSGGSPQMTMGHIHSTAEGPGIGFAAAAMTGLIDGGAEHLHDIFRHLVVVAGQHHFDRGHIDVSTPLVVPGVVQRCPLLDRKLDHAARIGSRLSLGR